MPQFSKEFLQQTAQVWQPHYDHPVTEEMAREIAENVVNLMLFVRELEQKYGAEEKT